MGRPQKSPKALSSRNIKEKVSTMNDQVRTCKEMKKKRLSKAFGLSASHALSELGSGPLASSRPLESSGPPELWPCGERPEGSP